MSKKSNGAEKKGKNYSFLFLNRFMFLQFILMVILAFFIARAISTRSIDNAKQNLSAITDQRAQIITEHVKNAENLLSGFSVSPDVADFLSNTNDSELKTNAQRYTEEYAKSIPGVEGLYIADMTSKTLTHSNPDSGIIGTVIREGDRLDALMESLNKAGDSVYTDSVLISPFTNDAVIAMYKAVYDPTNGRAVGFVGMAIRTADLIAKLENIKTPGLESSFYSMIDVKKRIYVFDENMEQACEPLQLPDLIRQCDIYENATETESTTYNFKLNGSFVGASYFIPEYHWLLMMNDTAKEVYSLAYAMRMFFIAFEILIIALMIIFGLLNKKQERVNQKLIASVDAVNETKKSLNTAMFGDILTGAGNRVKLATDLTGINDSKQNPYYFALFNIMEFSNINTAYGSDTGDSLLVRTADTLRDTFKNGEVYRTGSDEFVVMVKSENGVPRVSDVLFNVDEALKKLLVPENVRGLGTLYPKYKVAAIKKSSDIDASVITILKEMTNVKGEAMCGMIDFVDMSE